MKYLKMFESITESKIFNAIYKNPNIDIKYAKKLISTSSKSDLDYQDADGKSALSIAAYKGKLDIVKELIKAGANLKIKDKNDSCAIHWCNKNLGEYLEELIKAGADVNAQDGDGNTVLIYAANNEDLDIIKLLIRLGANVDIVNYDDDTALIYAALKNNIEIVDILLKNRKNKNKLNKNDYYFFDYLSDENKKYIIDKFPTLYKSYLYLSKIEKYN